MLEILKFIFSGPFIFLGVFVLLALLLCGLADIAAAIRGVSKRKGDE